MTDTQVSPRPSWDEYFLAIARAVSLRADCRTRKHGAVVVDPEHRIIATGYNGSPSGSPLSCLRGDCHRAMLRSYEKADDYSDCIALHAEQNAIAHATRDMRGGTIYITGEPCGMCAKLIAAAGLTAKWDPDYIGGEHG